MQVVQKLTCLLSRILRELTVRSSAAETTCRPSLVQARLVTAWSCGWLALATPFVAKSQMMISPKAPPAARASVLTPIRLYQELPEMLYQSHGRKDQRHACASGCTLHWLAYLQGVCPRG